jgi:membrane-associated protein
MEYVQYFTDLVLHLDVHLADLVSQYGPWVYGLLFLIVFCETGLVVTPFLPGDSLLFTTGALAATGVLDGRLAFLLLLVAAVLGDAVNYAIGHFVGPCVFRARDRTSFWHRLLNRDHLMKAHEFFERYGGMAVVLGRFAPIIRTFVPFVAGCGAMSYPRFALYNVAGALAWVGLCIGAGYAFGNVPVVKDNFALVIIGIVIVSLLPMAWSYWSNRTARSAARRID